LISEQPIGRLTERNYSTILPFSLLPTYRIMESKRQQKVARQLQKDLSEIFQREVPHLFNGPSGQGAFITVTNVRVSPDLSVARVYLSFLATKNKEMLLESIQEKGKDNPPALRRSGSPPTPHCSRT
jgi:hypothetical protein